MVSPPHILALSPSEPNYLSLQSLEPKYMHSCKLAQLQQRFRNYCQKLFCRSKITQKKDTASRQTSQVDGQAEDWMKSMSIRRRRVAGDVCAIFVHAGAGFHSVQNERTHLQVCEE